MAVEHANITDPNVHEPKGVSGANSREVYSADGSGSGEWRKVGDVAGGVYFVEDTATSSTAISITDADTYYDLTNDALGDDTNVSFGISGVDFWDADNNQIDFTGLSIGDSFTVRINLDVTTSGTNTQVNVILEAGSSGNEIQLPIFPETNFKDAGTYPISGYMGFFIRNQDVLDNPAKLKIKADATGSTVVVNDFYFNVTDRV